jgi:phosphopantetheine adenylyltransferase
MDEKNTNIIIRDPLMEPYFITRDKYGYVIMETVKTEDGEKTYDIFVGAYSNLGSCLKYIAKGIRNYKNKYESVSEYLKEWKKQEERIQKLTNIEL